MFYASSGNSSISMVYEICEADVILPSTFLFPVARFYCGAASMTSPSSCRSFITWWVTEEETDGSDDSDEGLPQPVHSYARFLWFWRFGIHAWPASADHHAGVSQIERSWLRFWRSARGGCQITKKNFWRGWWGRGVAPGLSRAKKRVKSRAMIDDRR